MDNNDFLSNDELKNILITNYHEIINKLKNYNTLSEYDKKIVLLSSFFDIRISIPYNYVKNIISNQEDLLIKNICNEHKIEDPAVCFYYTNGIPKLSVESYNSKIFMVIPTKGEYLIRKIENINLEDLILALRNNVYLYNIHNNIERHKEIFNYLNDAIEGIPYTLKRNYHRGKYV